MRDPKPSASPTGYCREVYPNRKVIDLVKQQEAGVRRLSDERWLRRIDACVSTDGRTATDWGAGFCD